MIQKINKKEIMKILGFVGEEDEESCTKDDRHEEDTSFFKSFWSLKAISKSLTNIRMEDILG